MSTRKIDPSLPEEVKNLAENGLDGEKTEEKGFEAPPVSNKEVDALRRELEAAKAQIRLLGKQVQAAPDEGTRTLIGWVMPAPGIRGTQRRPYFVKVIKDAELYIEDWYRECQRKGYQERGIREFKPGEPVKELEPWPPLSNRVAAGVPTDGGRF